MPLRIVLIGIGTRGDIQPLMALSQGLMRRGHRVRLLADSDSKPLADGLGIPNEPLLDSVRELADLGMRALAPRPAREKIALTKTLRLWFVPYAQQIAERCLAAARTCDLIIAGPAAKTVASALNELTRIPYVVVHYAPSIHTRAFRLPEALNQRFLPARLACALHQGVINWFAVPFHRALRRALRLPVCSPARAVRRYPPACVLCAFSPTVVPPPSDWPNNVYITGFFRLTNPTPLSPELSHFLDQTPAPLYIGLGSMSLPDDPRPFTEAILSAVRRSSCRAVLLRGWGSIDTISADDQIHVAETANHDALLPRVAGVIHHGGAGTTAAALYAGRPCAVLPVMADQWFWADRLQRLRCSAGTLPRQKVTAEGLARVMQRLLTEPALATAAQAINEKLRWSFIIY